MTAQGSRLRGMLSRATDEWGTPPDLFAVLEAKHGPFDLDAAASHFNAKCRRYLTVEDDALSHEWSGRVFVNPPFGRLVGRFVAHAVEQAARGAFVCALVPARTDTRWWHDHVIPNASSVEFLRGRLRFTNKNGEPTKANAPFPSAVVTFGGDL